MHAPLGVLNASLEKDPIGLDPLCCAASFQGKFDLSTTVRYMRLMLISLTKFSQYPLRERPFSDGASEDL